ncbi:MAG: LemA family protein [Thermoguttaceae bacterium]
MMLFLTVAGVVVAGVLAWIGVVFNALIRGRNQLREAWSGIDVQLKRRHDLVPGLVECVRGYRDHERMVLEEVAKARSRAVSAEGALQAGKAEGGLVRQLRSLFAVVEAYPELKANESFQSLRTNLVEIEDQLQFARRYYNGAVRDYNILVESFPTQIIAQAFGFPSAQYFEIDSPVERQVQEVRL